MVRHKLENINLEQKTADCSVCGLVSIYINRPKNGKEFWVCGRKLTQPVVKEHVLTYICEKSQTAYCKKCGLVRIIKHKDKLKDGSLSFHWRCNRKAKGKADRKKEFHRKNKKYYCEICGFIAVNSRQLDIHHKDGNHYNDKLENLQTICHNCHRLFHIKLDTYNNRLTKADKTKRFFRAVKNSVCARCGFIPEHSCQLSIHHKDENHKNNNLNNLETVCHNCHRLEHIKTQEEIDLVREIQILTQRWNILLRAVDKNEQG